jgi:EmrB/QacA subfamily drug resistance transporter
MEAAIGPQRRVDARMSAARRNWVLAVLCAAVGLVVASVTSLYVAGAAIARETGASETDLTWIIDVYTLAMGGLLLPAGALGDRFGRRGVMIVGLVVFVIAAVFLQIVDTPGTLIAARAALGIGGALILPSTLSLITSTFPPEFRNTGVGIWTAAFSITAVIGGTAAAILLEFFSWRSAFWSVLVGGILVLAAAFTLPSSREDDPPALDPPGSILSALSISALVFGFIEAGIHGWGSGRIIAAFAIGIGAAIAFALVELRTEKPLLDVRLFADRRFGVAAFTVTVSFGAVYGLAFLIFPLQQLIYGTSALTASLPMAAMAVSVLPITLVASRLTKMLGLRVVVGVGCLLNAAGFAILMAVDVDSPRLVLFAATLVIGCGLGLAMAPCTSAILDNVPDEKQGVAASVNHTVREVGTSLGVALFGGLLSTVYGSHILHATRQLPAPARDASRESLAAALRVAQQMGPDGSALATAARTAFVDAIQRTSLVMVCVMTGAAIIAACWAPTKRGRWDGGRRRQEDDRLLLRGA